MASWPAADGMPIFCGLLGQCQSSLVSCDSASGGCWSFCDLLGRCWSSVAPSAGAGLFVASWTGVGRVPIFG